MKWTFLGATAVLIMLPAAAQEPKIMGRGIGANSCAQVAKAYANDPDTVEVMAMSWAQGFMTATNISFASMGTHRYRDLGGDVKGQWAHMREYCDAHPLVEFSEAVLDLYHTMSFKNYP